MKKLLQHGFRTPTEETVETSLVTDVPLKLDTKPPFSEDDVLEILQALLSGNKTIFEMVFLKSHSAFLVNNFTRAVTFLEDNYTSFLSSPDQLFNRSVIKPLSPHTVSQLYEVITRRDTTLCYNLVFAGNVFHFLLKLRHPDAPAFYHRMKRISDPKTKRLIRFDSKVMLQYFLYLEEQKMVDELRRALYSFLWSSKRPEVEKQILLVCLRVLKGDSRKAQDLTKILTVACQQEFWDVHGTVLLTIMTEIPPKELKALPSKLGMHKPDVKDRTADHWKALAFFYSQGNRRADVNQLLQLMKQENVPDEVIHSVQDLVSVERQANE
eukprot:TRINITY_DN2958_c0_g2_i5.p2 TRINITY_DN2958_c0_g2~~TRINITY_DN2958_c0_g2_i5.p2  ORF type:complete len:325 (+),score=58.14 TRINITY_DN2958_c0_g2_i5:1831-2805(+)